MATVNELIIKPEFVSNILNEKTESGGGGGKVQSVNGKIGDVVLTAEDIGYNGTTIADALDNKAAIIVSSASGAIASFPDGSGGAVKSLVAQIEPAQDLHGYANPWPAGGGKNLLPDTMTSPTTAQGVTFTRNSKGEIAFSGTTSSSDFSVNVGEVTLAAGSYILTGGISTSARLRLSNATGDVYIGQDNGSGYSFTLSEATTVLVKMRLTSTSGTSVSGTYKPMIRLSSVTDATFQPYSNICPISGWTGAEGKRTGANVWDEQWRAGYYNSSTGEFVEGTSYNQMGSKNPIPCKGMSSIYLHVPKTGGGFDGSIRVVQYDAAGNVLSVANKTGAFTSDANAVAFNFNTFTGSNGYPGGNTYGNDISINYPSTDHDYHAYSGATIPVTFPDAAGTVYGGTLDVTNGVLTVDRAKITLNGTQNASITDWRPTSTSVGAVFPYNLTNNKIYQTDSSLPNIRSNYLKPITYAAAFQGTSDAAVTTLATTGTSSYGICIRIPDTSVTTQQQLMTYLAANPLDVVYELATPTTYQLTPQEVTTLLGANNIWFDVGSTTVEYPADTKLYIDKVISAAIAAL